MKLGALLFLALVMPFGLFVLAGMAVKHVVRSMRMRQVTAVR